MSATTEVVATAHRAAAEAPPATLAMARLCLLDWTALAIAGGDEPVVRLLVDQALAEGAHPLCSVPGQGRRFSARQAALIGGAAGHALDYDDVSLVMHVHATSVILPPLLALAEARRLGGAGVLRAFVAGFEGAGMIGAWLGSTPYNRGLHMTGTLGALGAALGAAHLIGLDAEASARALSLAASQAAGLKAQFGTMAKPLHAGRAAEAGLQAALWAEAGMTARTDILEASQGYAATQSAIPAAAPAWSGYALDRNLFKFHAACFGTHGTIEAAAALRREGLVLDEVEHVVVTVHPGLAQMCDIALPSTGAEARFSLRFAAAAGLAGAATGDPAFYDALALASPAITRWRDRVKVTFAAEDWPEDVTELRVISSDGCSRVARHDSGVVPPLAVVETALRRKAHALLSSRVTPAEAETLQAAIAAFDQVADLVPFMASLALSRSPKTLQPSPRVR